MRTTHWLCVAALTASVGACKKDDKKDEAKSSEKAKEKGSGSASGSGSSTASGSGSATASGSGSATASGSGSAAPAPTGDMTPEQEAARYAECWGFINDKKLDQFKACFTDDAKDQDVDDPTPSKGSDKIVEKLTAITTAFPDFHGDVQMTLVGDNHVVGIVLVTGTQDGDLPTKSGTAIPATHKKIGFLMGLVMDFDPKTKLATGQYGFFDPSNMLGQLGVMDIPHRDAASVQPIAEHGTVAVSTGSDVEKANLAALAAANDAFNKHDLDAWKATRTPDAMLYDSATPNDVNLEQMAAGVKKLFDTFADLKQNIGGAIACGDYVASFGDLEGSASGKSIKSGYLAVGHYKDGKLDKAWRFTNGLTIPMQLGLLK